MATKPTTEVLRDRAHAAGAWVGLTQVMEAVRARGGVILRDNEEVLFHWRLRKPIFIFRDPVTKRFMERPPLSPNR